jgi:hypothetical protein
MVYGDQLNAHADNAAREWNAGDVDEPLHSHSAIALQENSGGLLAQRDDGGGLE